MDEPRREVSNDLIASLLAGWRFCPATDPIGMEFGIQEEDPAVRQQLEAVRLTTAGEVYKALADGYFAAGKIYSER